MFVKNTIQQERFSQLFNKTSFSKGPNLLHRNSFLKENQILKPLNSTGDCPDLKESRIWYALPQRVGQWFISSPRIHQLWYAETLQGSFMF